MSEGAWARVEPGRFFFKLKAEKDVGGIFPHTALYQVEVLGNSAEISKTVGTSDDKRRKNFKSEEKAKKWAKKQMRRIVKELREKDFVIVTEEEHPDKSILEEAFWR